MLAATFRRVTSHPGGPFYNDGDACGGAILDLHIHDTDFIRHLLGDPAAVQTHGYTRVTGRPDHVSTVYRFAPDTPGLSDGALVMAEGSWALSEGFGFSMRYTINFENATADFDLARGEHPLHIYRDGNTEPINLPKGMGYDRELECYFACVREGPQADRVTLRDAAGSVQLHEAKLHAWQQGNL